MTQAVEQIQREDGPAVATAGWRRVRVYEGIYIDVPEAPWNARDRAAWKWPAKVLVPAWAEKYRYLTKSAIPGPWRNANAPYLVGIMLLAGIMGVVQLAIKKAAQVGVSEAARTLIGSWAQQDPSPTGLLLPNKEKGREIVENEVLPMFRKEFARDEDLRELLSPRLHDMKKGQIKLLHDFILYLMWSGSPASMASNPMKRAVADEVDKFVAWAGNDADPISLVEKRMRTYPDRLLFAMSTPTTADGLISVMFEQSHVKLYYLVACVHCGCRQRLLFGEGGDYGVKWTKEIRDLWAAGKNEEAGAAALVPGNVWYECCGCHGKINEREKRAMEREIDGGGKWGTVGEDLMRGDFAGGEERGAYRGGPIGDATAYDEYPSGTKLGLQIGSQYCCWEGWTMAHVAAEFLQARTLAQKFAFRTSTLGETWAQAVAGESVEVMDERVAEAAAAGMGEGVVPAWCGRLIGVADTQKDHFWLVIRAWGPGLRSQRVWHGRVESFAEIEQWCWRTPWGNRDSRLPARICDLVLIDSGGTKKYEEEEREGRALPSRVMDVYAWVLQHESMARAIKGDNRPEVGQYYRRGKGEYVTDREKRPVPIWLLDVHHWHDQLVDLMQQRVPVVDYATGEKKGEEAAWALNSRMDPEYHRHMAAMHKETVLEKGKRRQRWVPKREGMRVDYRACEAYQVAGAFMQGVHLLPDQGSFMAAVEANLARRNMAPLPPARPLIETPDGRAFVATERRE